MGPNRLSTLPPEILIYILSFVDAPSLVALSISSKEFHSFFSENEDVIWRNACQTHGLVEFVGMDGERDVGNEPPRREWGRWRDWKRRAREGHLGFGSIDFGDVNALYSKQSCLGLKEERNWKDIFRRRVDIHRSWSGELPSTTVRYPSEDDEMPASSFLSLIQRAIAITPPLDEDDPDFGEIELSEDEKWVKLARKLWNLDPQLKLEPTDMSELIMQVFNVHTCIAYLKRFIPSTKYVHRIKADERNGFVITTHRDGGLVVRDVITKKIQWCLPTNYVHEFAHLEYEQGYMIFDRLDGSKEVWRSSSLEASSRPDHPQTVVAALANGDEGVVSDAIKSFDADTEVREYRGALSSTVFSKIRGCQRDTEGLGLLDVGSVLDSDPESDPYHPALIGRLTLEDIQRCYGEGKTATTAQPHDPTRLSPKFVPHLVIPVPSVNGNPDRSQAFRFVYPYLLAASFHSAYVWDVRTGDLVQVVDDIQSVVVLSTYPVKQYQPNALVQKQDHLRTRGKEREAVCVTSDEDKEFPILPPFASGFMDQNAAFSMNLELRSLEAGDPRPPPLPNPATSTSLADPLLVATNERSELRWLRYVELGERWIFVCGSEGLRVFARGKEFFDESSLSFTRKPLHFSPGELAWRISSDKLHYSRWSASLGAQSFRPHWGSEVVRQEVVWDDEVVGKTEQEANVLMPRVRRTGAQIWGGEGRGRARRTRLYDEFVAVHVSPDQKHVAALLSSSRLIFVPYFERVVAAEASMWDVAIDIQLGPVQSPSVYLSYGCGESGSGGSAGRISVVTESGIFIVTPYFKPGVPFASAPGLEREVDITVHRLAPSFMDPKRLSDVTCLQMSDTGLWINWTPDQPGKPNQDATSSRSRQHDYIEWNDEEYFGDAADMDEDEDAGSEIYEEGDHQGGQQEATMEEDSGDEVSVEGADYERAALLLRSQAVDRDGSTHPHRVHPAKSTAGTNASEGSDPPHLRADERQASMVEPEASGTRWRTKHLGAKRTWRNQIFDLKTTPPSQFAEEGGKCKYNYAETSGDGKSREATKYERDAARYELEFVVNSRETRVTPAGTAGVGAREFGPFGDFAVRLNLTNRTNRDPRLGERGMVSEVHQIRFVPV